MFDKKLMNGKTLTKLFRRLDSRWRQSPREDESSLLLRLAQLNGKKVNSEEKIQNESAPGIK